MNNSIFYFALSRCLNRIKIDRGCTAIMGEQQLFWWFRMVWRSFIVLNIYNYEKDCNVGSFYRSRN